VEDILAGRSIFDEPAVLQIAQRQFTLRQEKLAAQVGRNDGGVETLRLAVLAPIAAIDVGMRREPQNLFLGYVEFLVDAFTEVMQAVKDAIFIFSTHP
jgi:hypothetical protein